MVTRVAVQSQGPRNIHREVTYISSWAAPPYACVWLCVCICRQTTYYYLHIRSTHTRSTHTPNQPIAHLEWATHDDSVCPPAEWGADSRGDNDVLCSMQEGGATACIVL